MLKHYIRFLKNKKKKRKLLDRKIRITLFNCRRFTYFLYRGKGYSKKKTSFLDLANHIGKYVLTRKLYARPLKYFKFNY